MPGRAAAESRAPRSRRWTTTSGLHTSWHRAEQAIAYATRRLRYYLRTLRRQTATVPRDAHHSWSAASGGPGLKAWAAARRHGVAAWRMPCIGKTRCGRKNVLVGADGGRTPWYSLLCCTRRRRVWKTYGRRGHFKLFSLTPPRLPNEQRCRHSKRDPLRHAWRCIFVSSPLIGCSYGRSTYTT